MPADHLTILRNMLGEGGVLSGSDAERYEHGARYDVGRAAFVARPSTTVEMSRVVSYCVRNGIHMVAQSGNTGVVSASTPDDSGTQAILSLDRLNKCLSIDLDNRSVSADAGFLLSDLNAALDEHGLFFPIDLGADPRLGGMISTNTGGARFVRYGDVRRNTLGLTVVLADEDGTVLRLGHGLRKNNTGVDWKQVFIGTSGSFGVITECVLNVERRPRQTATALLVPSGADKVMTLLHALETNAGDYLTAFEGMAQSAIAATYSQFPSLRNPFRNGEIPDYVILIELTRTWQEREGEQTLDSVLQDVLAAIWEMDGAPLADALVGPAHEIWAMRHMIPEGVKRMGKLVACDLSFKRGDLMRFCERMRQEIPLSFPDVTICDFGHIGDGGVHFNLVAPHESPTAKAPDFETRLREWVYEIAVNEYQGSYSGEHAIGRKNQSTYDKYTPNDIKRMALQLKQFTSPAGLGVARFG